MIEKEFRVLVNYTTAEENHFLNSVNLSELAIRITYDDIDKLSKNWNLPDDALIIKYLKEIACIEDNEKRYEQLFMLSIIGKRIYPIMKEIDERIMKYAEETN